MQVPYKDEKNTQKVIRLYLCTFVLEQEYHMYFFKSI